MGGPLHTACWWMVSGLRTLELSRLLLCRMKSWAGRFSWLMNRRYRNAGTWLRTLGFEMAGRTEDVVAAGDFVPLTVGYLEKLAA